jgi:ABC-type antimicrobial peptide transport system permease subunit
LSKKPGGLLNVRDQTGKERTFEFTGALKSSIFQGYVLIPEKEFAELYPSAGTHILLVDCTPEKVKKIRDELSAKLKRLGVKIESCGARLMKFKNLENTYLTIFLILGALGLITGSAGFGIIVLRNIAERRREFGIMHALGFEHKNVKKIVITEYLMLIADGTIAGCLAAAAATYPAVALAAEGVPWGIVFALPAGIVIIGGISVAAAVYFALDKLPADALRNE